MLSEVPLFDVCLLILRRFPPPGIGSVTVTVCGAEVAEPPELETVWVTVYCDASVYLWVSLAIRLDTPSLHPCHYPPDKSNHLW
jgi:hypothetical protein